MAGNESNDNFILLCSSIEKADLKTVMKILESEVDLNKKDDFGYHPLLTAINLGHLEIAVALLNAGASSTILGGYSLKNAIYTIRSRVWLLRRSFLGYLLNSIDLCLIKIEVVGVARS